MNAGADDDDRRGGTGGWWATAEPLSMVVVCGRERHRLAWREGRVETVDHPELEAELALVALGGEEPACIALHRLWHEAVDDGGFVAEWVEPNRLNPTWLSWLTMALERMRTEGFHEFLRHLPTARAQRMGEFLNRFPQPWVDRAAAEVNRVIVERAPGVVGDERDGLLAQAAANRLRRAFVDAVGGRQLAVGAAALVPLTPRVGPGIPPAIAGSLTGPGRGVSIAVDRSWLHRVWAAGAAVVDGHLVRELDGDPAGPGGARVRVVTWSDDRPRRPTVEPRTAHHRDGRWALGPPAVLPTPPDR